MGTPSKKILIFILLLLTSCKNVCADTPKTNIYQYTQAGLLNPAIKSALFRVYVPNGNSGTVSVIDPTTYQVIETFTTGKEPQHVAPSYDLQTLWVLNNGDNTLTQIDPTTGKPNQTIPVDDPYNLYYTTDGKFAIVVCEAMKQLQFRDPQTMKLITALPTQCNGANHMEFSPDGRYAIVTCEYAGQLMKVDLIDKKVVGYLALSKTPAVSCGNVAPVIVVAEDGQIYVKDSAQRNMESMPQDIRSNADGSLFFVADMVKDGLFLIDPEKFTKVGFIPTGAGAHSIYPSRDGKLFYVANRGCHQMTHCKHHGPGKITVIDPIKKKIIATWPLPNGGSPDMGNITPDGKELWLSGRYDNEVYVFDTTTGKLTHRIPVGNGPHGLAVWPQPGRYSLGHTGNMR